MATVSASGFWGYILVDHPWFPSGPPLVTLHTSYRDCLD
ncbi:hypothetical protein FOCG_13220 [Fusarium oxysporum f. sp. radicis-lycopersici 26381]|uniref:Uncharacterized protein n=6 Tax=Fusarium oxysporum TaxID=5507 RepID=W9HUD1_FUSOX|nr:hypothetical protein FOXG_20112 [Fusarium oxysporum f. sp. lycopersici 4287]EWY83826.1 hypothetical protein FOYG_13615 [Fusarium oxysporum NRRL 32931]EXA36243.1 hypothetical protein FOVG_13337 [Fusarium oxysporum f. sp. pisi HDV247]EXK29383.1 hypothetical protein FOMG_14537 [Fusarium oxysporum f. sp. melonis 26406]EXL45867.1 hypothetical protein FOCG_13220 [Fusarium oxysporum f. sp. radicis-lycopersici 26381]EXL75190.1 hypothetical protein FOPG_09838 [Fusarium oxysporum f. sp. conglutinans 